MIENLAYIVTALGVALSFLSMRYLFFGDRVIEKGDGKEKIKIGKNELEISKVFGAFLVSIITAILPLILLIQIPFSPLPKKYEEYIPPKTPSHAKEVCESLVGGAYKLLEPYRFINYGKEKLRGITQRGHLETKDCTPSNNGHFILHGIDASQHDIEIEIENEYKKIADFYIKFESQIYFDKSGRPYKRKLSEKPIEKLYVRSNSSISKYSKSIQKEIEIIYDKTIDNYEEKRQKRHGRSSSHSCYPSIGIKNNEDLIIIYCPTTQNEETYAYYLRIMGRCYPNDCKTFF